MKKSTLVTGASGFIGSNLVRFGKSKGIKIVTLDRVGSPDIKCDILDFDWDTLDLSEFKSVIHLAAETSVSESLVQPDKYRNANFKATKKLFYIHIL